MIDLILIALYLLPLAVITYVVVRLDLGPNWMILAVLPIINLIVTTILIILITLTMKAEDDHE